MHSLSQGNTRQQQQRLSDTVADVAALTQMIVNSASSSLVAPLPTPKGSQAGTHPYHRRSDDLESCTMQSFVGSTTRRPSLLASPHNHQGASSHADGSVSEKSFVGETTPPMLSTATGGSNATAEARGQRNGIGASSRGRRLPNAPSVSSGPQEGDGDNVHDADGQEPSPLIENPTLNLAAPASPPDGALVTDAACVGTNVDDHTTTGPAPSATTSSPVSAMTAMRQYHAQPQHEHRHSRRRASSIDLDQVREATAALEGLLKLRASLQFAQSLRSEATGSTFCGSTTTTSGLPPSKSVDMSVSADGVAHMNGVIASYIGDPCVPMQERLGRAANLTKDLYGLLASLEGFTRYVLSHVQPQPGTGSSGVTQLSGNAGAAVGQELATFQPNAIATTTTATDMWRQSTGAGKSTESVFAGSGNPPPPPPSDVGPPPSPSEDLPFGQFSAFTTLQQQSGSFNAVKPPATAPCGEVACSGTTTAATTSAQRLSLIPPLQVFRKHSLGVPQPAHSTKHLGVDPTFEQSPNVSSLMGTPVAGSRVPKTPTAAMLLNFLSVTSSAIEPPDDAASILALENEVQIARSQRAQFREDGGFEMINDYMILDELGRGATGAVYLAIHQTTDEPYAIKSLAKLKQRRMQLQRRMSVSDVGVGGSAGGPANIKEALRQQQPMDSSSRVKRVAIASPPEPPALLRPQPPNPIEQEITIMKSLKHPNLVTLHEVIDDDEDQQIHLVMDYCRYGPLLKIHGPSPAPSRKGSFMSPKSAVRNAQRAGATGCLATSVVRPISKLALYAGQICAGLRYLHKLNIVHRDIKPDNILIAEDDLVKITDFGESAITAILDDDGGELGGGHHHHKTAGTPAFFAPELCAVTRSGDAAPAAAVKLCSTTGKEADVWAFGVTLYAALVGKLPFHGTTLDEQCRAIVNDALVFPPLKDLPENAGISDVVYAYWKDALTSMLQKRPTERTSLKLLSQHPCIVGPSCASPAVLRRIETQMLDRGGDPVREVSKTRGRRTSTTLSLKDDFNGVEFHMVIDPAPHRQSSASGVPDDDASPVSDVQAPSPPSQPRDGSSVASNVRASRHGATTIATLDETDDDDDLGAVQALVFGRSAGGHASLSSRNAARVMFVSELKRRAVIHQATHLGIEPPAAASGDHYAGALLTQPLTSP